MITDRQGRSPLERRYLLPSQMLVCTTACEIVTVLGSCVAVCVHDSVAHIGGLTHYVLPDDVSGSSGPLRFGSLSIPMLINEVVRAGARRNRLVATIAGGATLQGVPPGRSIGERNIAIARTALSNARIPITREQVGGTHGRRLSFKTDDGVANIVELGA